MGCLNTKIGEKRSTLISHPAYWPTGMGIDTLRDENCKKHNTILFYAELGSSAVHLSPKTLIIRRGGTFKLFAGLPDNTCGENASFTATLTHEAPKFTLSFPFTTEDADRWGVGGGLGIACLAVQDGGRLCMLEVQIPADAPIGEYQFSLSATGVQNVVDGASVTDSNLSYNADLEAPVVILCNPWSEDDQVCMRISGQNQATLLQEYILEEEGLIWVGTATNHRGRAWNFDQFDVDVLRCVLLLLKGVPEKDLSNPVAIARYMSGKLNSAADGGVLQGNWSGNYEDGTKPSTWSGSRAILKQYLQGGGQTSVKFGQCWVFSGVFTTVMRCLGIPARSVTNFDSAHDTDDNRQINKYFDKQGEYDANVTTDSVWNFHVWNECFMQRPDLEEGRGGWQAVDATPQELSKIDGKFRCGPASVEAIKAGEKGDDSKYDNDFLVSEVNADVIYHMQNSNSDSIYSEVRRDTTKVGQFISTKQPGEWKRLDLTKNYKHADGSAAERAALYRNSDGEGDGATSGESVGEKQLVEFAVKMTSTAVPGSKTPLWWKLDHELVGCDLQWELQATSVDAAATHSVQVHLAAACCAYNGGVRRQIKVEKSTVRTGDGPATISLAMLEYMDFLSDECCLEFTAYAFVEGEEGSGKGQTYCAEETVYLQPPPLFVALADKKEKLTVDRGAKLLVTFTNPLPTPLTGVIITVDGAQKVVRSDEEAQPGIGANETAEMEVDITPRRTGKLQLIVGLESKELDVGIEGVLHATVHLAPRASQI
jgi:hypothetical protein